MSTTHSPQTSLRETLAAYFLSAPPYREQTPEQQDMFRQRLCQLGELEQQEILQSAGHHRPMHWGNPVSLIQNLLTASQRLAAGMGQPLLLFPAKEVNFTFSALFHPRLLSIGVCTLLRIACEAAPREPVWVRLQEQESCLTVSVTAAAPPVPSHSFAVIQECAGLHKGSPAQCGNTYGFSIARAEQPPEQTQRYVCPTADELYRDTLSPVWTAFYCRLSRTESSNSNPLDKDVPSTDEA